MSHLKSCEVETRGGRSHRGVVVLLGGRIGGGIIEEL